VKSAVDLKQSGGLLFALVGMSLFNVPLLSFPTAFPPMRTMQNQWKKKNKT